MTIRTIRTSILLFTMVFVAVATALPGRAEHNADVHSPNMRLVTTFTDDGEYHSGTDIAFWGSLAAFGNLDPGGFRLLDVSRPAAPRLLSTFECFGSQSDVSIWEDLVFLSIDGGRAGTECDADAAQPHETALGDAWEGIRIASIADPRRPKLLAAVDTECGSHTHTLVPDPARGRVLIYVLSYPLTQAADCNVVSHRKISVIEVPLADPAKAKVITTPSVEPAIGCHDVTIFAQRRLAAAACITESQLWDISDPANPKIISHIYNPLINIHHGTGFSWEGNTLVIGDELGGAAAAPGCLGLGAPLGALWFYDVSDPADPVEKGSFVPEQATASELCTAHNFNVIPLADNRDVLVSAWYDGGTVVVDFTDPAAPKEIGYYIPEGGTAWSSYFYNGFIYANNLSERGIDVLRLDEPFLASRVALGRMNAQTQERLSTAERPRPGAGSPAGGRDPAVRGTKRGGLAATGVSGSSWIGAALLLGAVAIGVRARRLS